MPFYQLDERTSLLPPRLAAVLLAALGLALVGAVAHRASAYDRPVPGAPQPVLRELARLERALQDAEGDAALLRAAGERTDSIFSYSARYRVPADLAALIYDIALAEGIDPDLGFRLVGVESGFNERAVSPAGAVGLAQVLPSTAQLLAPGITPEQMQRPAVNLHLGFRYLRGLLDRYRGDARLALVGYIGGPGKVRIFLEAGDDSVLAYTRKVMRR
jgi:soluble lytic murein transglycosylase-like protein